MSTGTQGPASSRALGVGLIYLPELLGGRVPSPCLFPLLPPWCLWMSELSLWWCGAVRPLVGGCLGESVCRRRDGRRARTSCLAVKQTVFSPALASPLLCDLSLVTQPLCAS